MLGKDHNVKRRYILSNFSLVLAVTALLGALSVVISIGEMHKTHVAEQQNRLALAFQDMNTQLDTMKTMQVNMKLSASYHPGHLRQSLIHELEMLKELRGFSSYFPFPVTYYLVYRDIDAVYFQDTKTSFDTLCDLYLQGADREALRRATLL